MNDKVRVQLTPVPTPTATEQVVAKALESVDVIDSAARVLTLRKPGVLAQYRLIECLGDSAKNQTYVSMVLPLIYVAAIDGEPLPPITRKSEVEALLQRLDEHGLAALMQGLNENFGSMDPDGDREAIKK